MKPLLPSIARHARAPHVCGLALLALAACAGSQPPSTAGQPEPAPEPGTSGSEGPRCGTRGGVSCGDGEFCNFEPDPECGATDRGGVCESKPEMCTLDYQPVCGCDRKTYANRCAAHSKAVSVLHERGCYDEDCAAVGGRVVPSIGSPPKCDAGEIEHGEVVARTGHSVEGSICCVPAAQ